MVLSLLLSLRELDDVLQLVTGRPPTDAQVDELALEDQ